MKDFTEFDARAVIRVGGKSYSLAGKGTISDRQGIVRGSYQHDIPANDFEPFILQVVLVTGYPSVCRSRLEENPFKHGDYYYSRRVGFEGYGELEYEARCWSEELPDGGRRLRSTFDVRTDVALPPIRPATTVREEWRSDADRIRSRFEIAWPLANGSGEVRGSAQSLYSPYDKAPRLTAARRRSIIFSDVAAGDGLLSLVQESWLEN